MSKGTTQPHNTVVTVVGKLGISRSEDHRSHRCTLRRLSIHRRFQVQRTMTATQLLNHMNGGQLSANRRLDVQRNRHNHTKRS